VQSSLIRIDIQVHQYLESRRTDPTQTHNDILREMIGLPFSGEKASDEVDATPKLSHGWSSAGVELPNGTKVRMSYNNQMYAGVIAQGISHTGGASYQSPSGAASDVARWAWLAGHTGRSRRLATIVGFKLASSGSERGV
jgi:hypothetical protein